jgi:hypothetical protein
VPLLLHHNTRQTVLLDNDVEIIEKESQKLGELRMRMGEESYQNSTPAKTLQDTASQISRIGGIAAAYFFDTILNQCMLFI